MSLLAVAHFDKCIIDHLAVMGTLDDPKGDLFVQRLVDESLKNSEIGAAATAQMLSRSDLVIAYKTVVKELYPDIFICHGLRPILSPSMPFLDKRAFPSFAAVLGSAVSVSDPPDVRREMIALSAVVFCRELWQQALAQGKVRDQEWAFARVQGRSSHTPGRGCLGALVIGLFVGATLGIGLYALV